MSWQTDFQLIIEKPQVSPWAVKETPAYQNDENLKKLFGIELAKSSNSFEAGCKVFGEETSKALWASFNWVNDPLVIASRDVYEKTIASNTPLLDKEQLASKVLALADEKILKNGTYVPSIEAKDRIAALKLYSEIAGYTGKVEIDNSVKNITNNELTIKLVKPDTKAVIENAPLNSKSEMVNENLPPITLKLVGGVSR